MKFSFRRYRWGGLKGVGEILGCPQKLACKRCPPPLAGHFLCPKSVSQKNLDNKAACFLRQLTIAIGVFTQDGIYFARELVEMILLGLGKFL